MKKFFKDFKAFISRGNIIDLAIGVIIGGAFSAIVTALTNKILMPVINWIISKIVGGNGLDAVYTFLSKVYTVDANGDQVIDLAKSIYIDWGAFITAVINFLLIALVLFLIIKAMMNAKNLVKKTVSETPTKAERKELKAKGVNLKNRKETVEATAQLRQEKADAEAKAKAEADAKARLENPTQEDLLKEIRDLLKANMKEEKPKKKAVKDAE